MTLTVHGAGAVAACRVRAARARVRDRLGPFRAPPVRLGGRRCARRLPGRQLHPARDHHRRGHRRGRQDHRLHARAATRTTTAGHPSSEQVANRSSRSPSRCMHLGCPVRWTQAAARFICPCHGGVYDFQGKVSGGPPVRPLDHFYTRVRNGQVEVGPRYSVNSEFKRFPSFRDPGQSLDGIGQYLYPGPLLDSEAIDPMKLQLPPAPDPQALPGRPAAARARPRSPSRSTRSRKAASAPRTGSTSAPRSPAASAG